ncbi:ABC transporter permease [Leucobacter sp. GX24907]
MSVPSNHPAPETQAIAIAAGGRRNAKDGRRKALILNGLASTPALLLVVVIVVLPIGAAGLASLQVDGEWSVQNYVTFFTQPPYLSILWNTTVISLVVTICSILTAAVAGAFFSHHAKKSGTLFMGIIAASIWISVLVKTYAWQVVFSREGLIGSIHTWVSSPEEPMSLMYTRTAVIIAMIQFMIPFAVMVVLPGMKKIDISFWITARSLGAGIWESFRIAYWPQVRTIILGATILVFSLSMGFFVIPALLGGFGDVMLGQQMQSEVRSKLDASMAGTLGIVITAVLLIITALLARVSGVPFRQIARSASR